MDNYSSISKSKRILAYVLRFIHNCRYHDKRRVGTLSFYERKEALIVMCKYAQSISFETDILKLKNGNYPSRFLRKLNFLDEQGILRVGGRIKHSSLGFENKHPIVLPRNSRITVLIIEDFHRNFMHPGAQTLHFLIIQNFWILSQNELLE
ncbi:hypothetical protein PPYR_15510, partial [Photinus pyralis]